MKKSRTRIISLLPVSLVVGILTAFAMRPYYHVQANRVLIAAVKADDTHSALASPKAPAKEIGPSRLAQAVQHNDTVLAKELLGKGATNVNELVRSLHGRHSLAEPIPLLAVAAEAGNLIVCQALIAHGADVNLGGDNCALKMAAEGGHSDVIRFLFQHGAHLDTPEEISEYCSLMAAARSGNLESVRILLAHGADATSASRWGSALNQAVDGGNLSVVTLLVEAGADVNIGGTEVGSPLQNAAGAGDVAIVRYLLSHGADVNEGYFRSFGTPLQAAVKGGHPKVVRLLLEHGADCEKKVEAEEDTALSLAQRTGNKEIIQMLKKAGAKE